MWFVVPYLSGHELLGYVFLEEGEERLEPSAFLPEERRLSDATGEQRAHDHSARRVTLVHLPHHQYVADLGILVRLKVLRRIIERQSDNLRVDMIFESCRWNDQKLERV